MEYYLFLFAIATRALALFLGIAVVWIFYRKSDFFQIGYAQASIFAIALLMLGIFVNAIFATFPPWYSEFWVSGSFTDDVTIFLLSFGTSLLLKIIWNVVIKR